MMNLSDRKDEDGFIVLDYLKSQNYYPQIDKAISKIEEFLGDFGPKTDALSGKSNNLKKNKEKYLKLKQELGAILEKMKKIQKEKYPN